ncbi:hypothetical protein [uncultured Alsobacter sp.]|uniref:hypothetical protein n=1 Tax=uncultured Alsobacter sp. TaxID=1748258 RepID=UPI0025EF15C5|nr:hypothetical protein [uncultured Alsobacter sp.]
MSDKSARKFEKLRTAYETAREARKAASAATRELRTSNGGVLTAAALGSKAGVKAVEAELDALRQERRALKRLAAHAVRHADDGVPDATAVAKAGAKTKVQASPEASGTERKADRRKGGKA